MTTTLNGTPNGRARKTLSSQIDRLDATLDGLSEAIPEVVADAIRAVAAQAVRDAVREAVTEVLTNPLVLETLRAAAAPVAQAAPAQPAPKGPTLWGRLAVAAKAGWDWARGKAARAAKAVGGAAAACAELAVDVTETFVEAAVTAVTRARARARSLAGTLGAVLTLMWAVLRHFRTPLLVACGAGLLVGVGCYLAGPVVASAVSGLAGFCGALSGGVLRAVWRSSFVLNLRKD